MRPIRVPAILGFRRRGLARSAHAVPVGRLLDTLAWFPVARPFGQLAWPLVRLARHVDSRGYLSCRLARSARSVRSSRAVGSANDSLLSPERQAIGAFPSTVRFASLSMKPPVAADGKHPRNSRFLFPVIDFVDNALPKKWQMPALPIHIPWEYDLAAIEIPDSHQ